MYYWHYGTLALSMLGGAPWSAWSDALQQAVLPNQVQDGCAKGSWEPVGPWGEDGGRIYATAMMTLALEIIAREGRGR